MYNFLNPKLLPKVTTLSACLDEFEPQNLVSPDFIKKSRGFIAYSTVKAPVDVDFELICSVNLSHISITATNGKQRCTGFEILAKTPSSNFVTISRLFFKEDRVVVCNARNYSKRKKPNDTSDNDYLSFFRANEFRTFLNASTIRIRILKTDRTIPCLGNVQIWGRVSKACSKVTIDTINKLLSNRESDRVVTQLKVLENKNVDNFEIPEEFKDELTFEVMSLPMTLPSGHTVDQSTLEKCAATDEMCGRYPSDPFTGLKFQDGRKPVFNAALKARIDMFLMQNSFRKETFSIKRTLGRENYLKENLGSLNYAPEFVENVKKIKIDHSNGTLDDAVRNAMNNSDFIRFTDDTVKNVNNEENNKKSCVKCKKFDCSLYIVSCKHLYCKDCLLKLGDLCDICKGKISKKETERFHFIPDRVHV